MKNMKKNIIQGIKRILNAFIYSKDGLKAMFQSEPAFRQDLAVFVVFAILAFLCPVSSVECALMLFSLFLILFAESVNTAIEVCIDRISEDIHPLSKKAKDIGSFVVLLSFINAIVVWAVILL